MVSDAKCTKRLPEEKMALSDSLIDGLLRDRTKAMLLVKQVRVARLEHLSAHMLDFSSKNEVFNIPEHRLQCLHHG